MKISVAVFFGGRSVEHEISVISAVQAIRSMDASKYQIVPIYITKEGKWYSGEALLEMEHYRDMPSLLAKCEAVYMTPIYGDNVVYKVQQKLFGKKEWATIDVAFPILHGTFGEDGALQGLLELKGLPYAGCDVLSSAIGMDKIIMKMVLAESQIPVVEYCWFNSREWYDTQALILKKVEKIGFPVIVKPANLGSSVGISKAKNIEELNEAIEVAGSFSQRILVERMVNDLQEINCSVVGDANKTEASVCEEPQRSGDFLSYQDKYLSKNNANKGMSGTQRQIPAKLPPETARRIQALAQQTFKVLGSAGVARIDFLIDRATDEIFVNEINSIPGSLSFYLWKPSGKPYPHLLDQLINIALKRHRDSENLVISYDQNIFKMGGGTMKLGKAK